MSGGMLFARFPDGKVKYGEYRGTSDTALPFLTDNPSDVFRKYKEGDYSWEENPDDEVLPVDLATNYGGGFHWKGFATHDTITEGFDPYEDGNLVDGLPDWVFDL
jgi:hypothetical protein